MRARKLSALYTPKMSHSQIQNHCEYLAGENWGKGSRKPFRSLEQESDSAIGPDDVTAVCHFESREAGQCMPRLDLTAYYLIVANERDRQQRSAAHFIGNQLSD